jgi:hypothetical protein
MPVKAARPAFEKKSTWCGSYWVSGDTRYNLKARLRDCATTRFKEASLGGEQEQGFEQAFASLAYAYMKDKAPRLLDFIVGFQLVDRNQDNTKAVGIFGFKVGDMWLYGPCFFLNGDLKGHELLYIKKQDAFVPLKENWVNHLISMRPHTLGEGSDKTTHQLGGMLPNVQRMSGNHGVKYSADKDTPAPVHVADWALPAMPLVASLAAKRAAALYGETVKTASLNFAKVVEHPLRAALRPFAGQFDMREALTSYPLLKAAYLTARQYPLIKQGFDRFYGPDFFRDQALKIKAEQDSLLKTSADLIPPPRRPRNKNRYQAYRKLTSSLIPDDQEEKQGADVYLLDIGTDSFRVVKYAANAVKDDAPVTVNKDELTEDERQSLLDDTVLIKDERDPHKTSVAYNTQTRLELMNPSETGLYDVLEKPGSFDQMLIVHNPHSGRGRENFSLVLRKSSPRNWLNAHSSHVWARPEDAGVRKDFQTYVDGLGGTDTLKKGGAYVALGPNGSGTCVFVVKETYGDGSYKVDWRDHCDYNLRSQHKDERDWDYSLGYHNWDAKLHINANKGTGLKSLNGELYVPESFKVLKVADPPEPKDEEDSLLCCHPTPCTDGSEGSDTRPIRPGNIVDVQVMLQKDAAYVSIHDMGAGEVWLKSRLGQERMNKRAALVSLVRDHGLTERQSRHMLKEAAALSVHNRAARFRVKYAYGYGDSDLSGGPNAPPFPEPDYGSEQVGYDSYPAIYPQEEEVPVDDLAGSNYDQSVYDPFYMPDQQATQVAQQASSAGQKEVFDTAMISGMLKSVSGGSLVDKHLGPLMKALDNLGRILFMYYWHQEEFEERYGKQDMPELEDAIRNAFEALGEVVLYLKEKTVQGTVNMGGAGVGQSTDGEPSIEQTARN